MCRLYSRFIRFCFGLLVAGIFLSNAWADTLTVSLESWVGKKPTEEIDQSNFFGNFDLYQPIQQGLPQSILKKIATYNYHQQVEKVDHYLVLQGSNCLEECGSQPGYFNVDSYAMLIDIAPQADSPIWQPRLVLCWQEYHQVGDTKDRRQYTNIIHYYTDNGERREMVATNHQDNNGGCTMGNEFYEANDVMKHLSLVGELFQHLRFSGAY